jgi:hypothetical protein
VPLSRGTGRTAGLAPLLKHTPKIYVGPRAESALQGARCVLLGAQRPRWVDVLELGPCDGGSVTSLVDRRFQGFDEWEAVGVSLPGREGTRHRSELLRELVPGDVLLSGGTPLVHMGDRWERAALVRETRTRARSTKST